MITCPRRIEGPQYAVKDEDSYDLRDDGKNHCSYCGSLDPHEFMRMCEFKECTLGPTDKPYKVYVDFANPNVGKPTIITSCNHLGDNSIGDWIEVTDENRDSLPLSAYQRKYPEAFKYVKITAEGPIVNGKFYFQHLSEPERMRFVDLLNRGRLQISYPGRFYVRPFFIGIGGNP